MREAGYIVVGAGSVGAVVVARLSVGETGSVLLLEGRPEKAGRDDRSMMAP